MRTLHRYLVGQTLASLLMTVGVFTFILLISNVLKEILGLLVTGSIGFGHILQALGLLVPFVLAFALPMGLLTATLLVFGRFSADNELTAVRASGVSLVALVAPVLLMSLALSALCAWINLEVAPFCRVTYKQLIADVAISRLSSFIPEKTYIKDFPGKIVYVDEVKGPNLKDILIYNLEEDAVESYIRASEGHLQIDRTNNVIHVKLVDAWWIGLVEGKRTPVPVSIGESLLTYTNLPTRSPQKRPAKLTEMTFSQLRDELKFLEDRIVQPKPVEKLPREELQARMKEVEAQREELTMPLKVHMHRQISFSFACVGFTLVGIPLGIRAHRRETTFGIAVALLLVAVYYSFFITGQSLETQPELFPHLILWLPNFIFQAVGAVLLWRANKGV